LMKLKTLLKDFNLLATTSRGNEKQMCSELSYLLKEELGDPVPVVGKTGIRGLVAAKTAFDPCEVIEKFRAILQERPYEFRYALRIIPVERVVRTDLDEVKHAAMELAATIGENETFRVTVEKRFTSLHSRDLIEAVATGIDRKVDLENPDKILLIEIVGGLTGMSLIKPSDILAVLKEKML
jgi:tRNA acetyltransferase TAN1